MVSGSDRQLSFCTQVPDKKDGQSNCSIKGWSGKPVAYPNLVLKCSWTHDGLSRRKSGDRYPLRPPSYGEAGVNGVPAGKHLLSTNFCCCSESVSDKH